MLKFIYQTVLRPPYPLGVILQEFRNTPSRVLLQCQVVTDRQTDKTDTVQQHMPCLYTASHKMEKHGPEVTVA